MLSIGSISWMWMHYIFGLQGLIWWWILHSASKSSTEQSSRNVIYLLAPTIHMLPASYVYDLYSCATLLLGSFAQARMSKFFFLSQTDLPLFLSLSLCNLTHHYCQQVPVCMSPIVWCEAQWDTKFSNSIQPLRQKVSQELCCVQHPQFKKNNSNRWVWGSGLIG
jgi:hypothetical protein